MSSTALNNILLPVPSHSITPSAKWVCVQSAASWRHTNLMPTSKVNLWMTGQVYSWKDKLSSRLTRPVVWPVELNLFDLLYVETTVELSDDISWFCLKPLDTFGKQYCPRPTLRVSQHVYNITNLWKFRLNRSSESGENNGKTNPCFRKLPCHDICLK